MRPEYSSGAPLGKEIMMASYLAFNKTLLSQKACIPEKSCYGTLSGSYGRYFRIRHEKSREAHPGGQITMTSRDKEIYYAFKFVTVFIYNFWF